MGADGAGVAARNRAGEDVPRPLPFQGRKRPGGEREERLPRNLLGNAGGRLEHLDGAGEEGDGRAGGEHGRGVIERPRAAHFDGSQSQRAGYGCEALARFRPVARDAGRRPPQDSWTAAPRNGPQGMERSDLRAAALRARERLEIERAGAVGDDLPRTDRVGGETAHLGHRGIGHREEHHLGVADAVEIRAPG
jgi:hypothetical protein